MNEKRYHFADQAEIRSLADDEIRQRKINDDGYHSLLRPLNDITGRHTLRMDLVFKLPDSMTEEETAKVDAIIRNAWSEVFYGVLRATDARNKGK